MFGRAAGILLVLAAIGTLGGLLAFYTPLSVWVAMGDATLYIGTLTVAGYYGWYLLPHIRVWQAQLGIASLTQLVCLAITEASMAALGLERAETFFAGLPLRLLIGVLAWAILFQWYWRLAAREEEEVEGPALPGDTSLPVPQAEILDRISVKEGTRIHLISVDELLYIQASGDYATLVTAEGQYVKEQTMKYFETHLPAATFVRIHRSSIVNVNHILRIELFGKDSYRVRLPNNITLRASVSGYRLLKERLEL